MQALYKRIILTATGGFVFLSALQSQHIYEYHHGADGPDEIEYFYVRKPKGRETENAPVNGVLCYSSFSGKREAIMRILRNHQSALEFAQQIANDSSSVDPDLVRPGFDYLAFAYEYNQDLNLMDFADHMGLAVISWTRADFGHNKYTNFDEKRSGSVRQENRDFEPSLRSWKKAIPRLAQKYNLPQENYLMFGISGGAQWAHRFAFREPHYFTAIHISINSSFEAPTSDARDILWLSSTGELEVGYPAAKMFYAKCQELGYNIMFKASENAGHDHTAEAKALSIAFFQYVLEKQKLAKSMGVQVKDLFRQDFSRPPYFGDYLNQFVIPESQVELIRPEFRVMLPTREIAAAWGRVLE